MELIRLRRLGVVMTVATLAAGTPLAFAPPASATTIGHSCTHYGAWHTFCIDIFGSGRHVEVIKAFSPDSKWNGYVVVTVKSPSQKTLYTKKSRYAAKQSSEPFTVGKTFPKNAKNKHDSACVTGYSIQNGKYHQFARACRSIF